MKPPWNGLAFRLGIIAVVGMLVLQLAFLTIMVWPDGRPAMLRLVPPREAGAIVRAVDAAPAELRPVVVEALNTSRQIVSLLPAPPDDEAAVLTPLSRRSSVFDAYGRELGGRPYRIQRLQQQAWGSILSGRVGAPGSMRLLVELNSGEVLTIQRAPIVLQTLFARLSIIAAAGALVLLGMTGLFYVQVILPIDRLARGTAAIAPDGEGPDVPERGPAEIRRLAECLNDMRNRIRELISNRTRELAAIAHDLRTYLTRLRLRAEFIQDSAEREAAIRDLEEMGLLLDDTLLFAAQVHKRSTPPAEDIDLMAELHALAAMRQEAGQRVEVVTPRTPAIRVRCAPTALRRILANLVDNAVRYGGAARLSAGTAGDAVRLIVEDEGPGVPPEALARLMEPFLRLEPSRGRDTGGAGLGLTIVKALAESQGGGLELALAEPHGLRAVVHLPRSPRVTV